MPKLIYPQIGTPGYYLRELREFYELNQSDIEDDRINRVKISRIESNHKDTILTESDCKIIAENIIKIVGKNLKQDKEFLYLYYYDHEKYIAAEKAQQIFRIVQNDFDSNDFEGFLKDFKLFDDIFTKYDLPEIKIKSFLLIAKFLRIKNKLHEAYTYACRALDNALLTKDTGSQITSSVVLAQYSYYMGNYVQCIDICIGILKKYNLNDLQHSWVYYNLAQAYRKESEYDLALTNYEVLKKYINKNNINQYTDIQNSVAICYSKQRSHDKAIQILSDLLKDLDDNHTMQQVITLDTLIDICKNEKDKNIDNIKLYANTLRILLPQINSNDNMNDQVNHSSQLYYNLAETYDLLGEFDYSESFYNKAIELSKVKNNTELQYKCLLNLFDLYIKYDRKSRINLLITNLSEALTNISIKSDNRFILKLLQNFIKCGQFDECSCIVNLLLKGRNVNES